MDSSKRRLPAALLAVLLWSTNAYAADLALARMTVEWLLLVQFTTAATALLAADVLRKEGGVGAIVRRPRPASTANEHTGFHPRSAVVGVGGLTGTIFLQYVAFATAPIVAANVLAYGWPLLAAGWVAATRRSRHALFSAALALAGFGGVVLIFAGAGAQELGTAATWGYLAALGSAVCMAGYTLGAIGTMTSTTRLLVPATLTGAATSVLLVVVSSGPSPSTSGVLAAAYIGLAPMAAGYALWTRAMAHGGAERLAPLGYATPLLSTILLLVTGASATSSTLVGVGLVLACSIGVLAHEGHASSPAAPSRRPPTDRQPRPTAC